MIPFGTWVPVAARRLRTAIRVYYFTLLNCKMQAKRIPPAPMIPHWIGLDVCPVVYLKNHIARLCYLFDACFLWLWLSHPLTAFWYVIPVLWCQGIGPVAPRVFLSSESVTVKTTVPIPREWSLLFTIALFIFKGIFAAGIRPPPRSWTTWNFEGLEPVEIIKRKKLLMTSGRRKTKSNHLL